MPTRSKVCYALKSLTLVSVLTAPFVLAESPTGFYAGVSVGQAKSEIDDKIEKAVKADGGSLKTDDESTGWKLYGGYQFSEYLAGEAFYADLGKTELKAAMTDKTMSTTIKSRGVGMAGIATWPVNEQFGLYGKGGFLYWDTEVETKPVINNGKNDEKGFSPMFGLGAKYSFNEQVSVKIEWERYMKVGKKDDYDGADIDMISAGIEYAF